MQMGVRNCEYFTSSFMRMRMVLMRPAAISLLLLFVVVLLVAPNSASSASVPVFIFGDSLADVGNNNYLPLTVAKSNFLPFGIDYSSGNDPTGRFSNGELVLDMLADRMGFAVTLPYLSPKARGSALLNGLNYASAGCGILKETAAFNSSGCLSLPAQVNGHAKTVQSIIDQLGIELAQSVLSTSVYFMVVGNNDFIGNYYKKNSASSKAYTSSQFIDVLMNALKAQISALYEQSAKKFILVGLGPLGCLPSQRNKGACDVAMNNSTLAFNNALKDLMLTLSSQFMDMKMTVANPYSLVEDLIQNPSQYGLQDTSTACCGGGPSNSPCLPLFPYCRNRGKRLFWDVYHPTKVANSYIADALLNTNNNYVAPYTLSEMFSNT